MLRQFTPSKSRAFHKKINKEKKKKARRRKKKEAMLNVSLFLFELSSPILFENADGTQEYYQRKREGGEEEEDEEKREKQTVLLIMDEIEGLK